MSTLSMLPVIAGVLVFNAVIGGLIVLGVFSFIERNPLYGTFGGVFLGALVIYGEATLGESMFTVTVQEMKLLVLGGALGAVLGVVVTMMTFKPTDDVFA